MLTSLVSGQRADYLIGDARAAVADHPDVIAAVTRASEAQEQLLAAARAEGRLRADATTLDLRLLFAATRAARGVEPDQWQRMLELMIDALDARRGRPAGSARPTNKVGPDPTRGKESPVEDARRGPGGVRQAPPGD